MWNTQTSFSLILLLPFGLKFAMREVVIYVEISYHRGGYILLVMRRFLDTTCAILTLRKPTRELQMEKWSRISFLPVC